MPKRDNRPTIPANSLGHPGANHKVGYVKHARGRLRGHYTALVPDPSYVGWPIVAHPMPLPVPEIVLEQGWLYAVGQSPCVGTTAVVAQAEGCVIVLQCYSTSDTQHFHRVYYLEGAADKLVWLFRQPMTARLGEGPMTVGTFVDAEVSAAVGGTFVKWKGSGTNPPPSIETLLPSDATYGLIAPAIDALRDSNDIG